MTQDDLVTTGVDDLLSYLEGKTKVSIKDTATDLNISEQTLQLWVDFLVEERVIGIEYKFTKPYIYLNKKLNKSSAPSKKKKVTLETFRNEYFKSAREKKIPEDKIQEFWNAKIQQIVEEQKEFFYREANKRGLDDTSSLFSMYTKKIFDKANS
ncbi:MAG: hypothetical protein ACQESC_03230 [Nanobdellota archaeon]